MGTTTNLALPYPASIDHTRLWEHIQNLAVAIDTAIGPLPLVRRVGSSSVTSTGSSFTSETVTDTITVNLTSGKVYEIKASQMWSSSVVDDINMATIRENNISGTVLQQRSVQLPNTSRWFGTEMSVLYTAVATGSKTFVVTGQRVAGSGNITRGGATTTPSVMTVNQVS